MRVFYPRAALLAGAAILVPAMPVHAAEAAADGVASSAERKTERDYLARDVVVTGQQEGYRVTDGSTATKTPTPLIDVPQSVAMITRDQFDDQGITTLGDALRFGPGVSIKTGEGHRDDLIIRGQRTTADFYIDGIRDDGEYYRSLYNIDRVEVIKRSNALIFGRGAGGGAINRVTKKAQLDRLILGGAAGVDTFGAFNLAADLGAPVSESAALRLNATYEEFKNHRDVYEGRFIGVNPTATVALGAATTLRLSYSYEDDDRVTDRGIPSFNGRPLAGYDKAFFGDPDYNRFRLKAHIARAQLEHRFSDSLSANMSLQYANYDKYYANIVPGAVSAKNGKPDQVSLSGYNNRNMRENWLGQANLIWKGQSGDVGHTVLIGVEASRQDTDSGRISTLFNGKTSTLVPLARTITVPSFTFKETRGARSKLSTVSLYIQDQIDLADWLQVVAGLRYDVFDLESNNFVEKFNGARKDEKVNPRFGLIIKPQKNLSLYASYSESFLPSAGDQFTVLDKGNVISKPEQFRNLEAGVKWAPTEKLLATAAIFRLDRTNTPSPTATGDGFTILTGASRVQGVEVSLAGSPTDRLHVNLGYTYLDGEIRSATDEAKTGAALAQVPKHQIGAWGRYDVTERFGLGLGMVHQSSQYATYSNAVTLPAYTRFDAAAYYTVNDRMSVQVNIDNLFDKRYYASAHSDNNIQPAKPFSARFGVKFAL